MVRKRASGRDRISDAPDAGPEPDAYEVARLMALRRLDYKAQTRAELQTHLLGKGVSAEDTEQVLNRFEDVGLLDDQRYAQAWAQSRHGNRYHSRRLIQQELRRKGVDDELIEEVVADIDHESELAAAKAMIDRKAASMSGLPREVAFRRLSGMLARKGYGPQVVVPVVRDLLQALAADEGDEAGDWPGESLP